MLGFRIYALDTLTDSRGVHARQHGPNAMGPHGCVRIIMQNAFVRSVPLWPGDVARRTARFDGEVWRWWSHEGRVPHFGWHMYTCPCCRGYAHLLWSVWSVVVAVDAVDVVTRCERHKLKLYLVGVCVCVYVSEDPHLSKN